MNTTARSVSSVLNVLKNVHAQTVMVVTQPLENVSASLVTMDLPVPKSAQKESSVTSVHRIVLNVDLDRLVIISMDNVCVPLDSKVLSVRDHALQDFGETVVDKCVDVHLSSSSVMHRLGNAVVRQVSIENIKQLLKDILRKTMFSINIICFQDSKEIDVTNRVKTVTMDQIASRSVNVKEPRLLRAIECQEPVTVIQDSPESFAMHVSLKYSHLRNLKRLTFQCVPSLHLV